jgi:hypothetical protein
MGFIVRAFRSTRIAIAATAAMAVSVLAANAWANVNTGAVTIDGDPAGDVAAPGASH